MAALLIVDDEPEYREELVEALSLHGIDAVAVGRGVNAIEALTSDPSIRIVLSDLRMPDMDGLTLVNTVKSAFPHRAITFFIMTGHATPEDTQKVLTQGVARCFAKPLAFEVLCDALSACNELRDDVN